MTTEYIPMPPVSSLTRALHRRATPKRRSIASIFLISQLFCAQRLSVEPLPFPQDARPLEEAPLTCRFFKTFEGYYFREFLFAALLKPYSTTRATPLARLFPRISIRGFIEATARQIVFCATTKFPRISIRGFIEARLFGSRDRS